MTHGPSTPESDQLPPNETSNTKPVWQTRFGNPKGKVQEMSEDTEMKNPGGRPRGYTLDQVREVVGALAGKGVPVAEITAAKVKATLCDDHGVTKGIDVRSLEDAVRQVLEEREEEGRRALLQALPASVAPAMAEALARMQQEMLLIVARENAVCQTRAETECAELRRDKANAHWRIQEIEQQAQDQASRIAVLEQEREAALADAARARDELTMLRTDMERREREGGTVTRLISELRNPDTLAMIRAALAGIVDPVAPDVRPNTP